MASSSDPLTLSILPEEPSSPTNEEEPTVLEYARFHGLCRDYLTEPLLGADEIPDVTTMDIDLKDPPSGSTIASFVGNFSVQERLSISKEDAAYLKSLYSMPDLDSTFGDLPLARNKFKTLRQELPLLRSDHDVDISRFLRDVDLGLGGLELPLEVVDDEQDEGFGWPSVYLTIPAEVENEARSEKLEIPKDAILWLHSVIKPEKKDGIISEESGLFRSKIALFEPVTPPLLPLSLTSTPAPSSSLGSLEPFSEATDSTAAEARALEATIMEEDALTPKSMPRPLDANNTNINPVITSDIDIGELFSPLREVNEAVFQTPPKRKIDLKVEVPLTPLYPKSKKLKSVSFSEAMHEFIPELPSLYENGDDILASDNSFDAFFNEVIVPIGERVNREVEQEQLQEINTTYRVDIPVMDFKLPVPPWEKDNLGTMRGQGQMDLEIECELIAKSQSMELQQMREWKENLGKLELSLEWNPFPRDLKQRASQEAIEENGSLDKVLELLTIHDALDSSSLIWKPDGLRVLDPSEDTDDELEPGDFSKNQEDMDTLIRKRKLQMDESSRETGKFLKVLHSETYRPEIPKDTGSLPSTETISTQPVSGKDNSLFFGGIFSASAALDNFMALHGVKADEKPRERHEQSIHTNPSVINEEGPESVCDIGISLQPHSILAPTPLPTTRPPCSVIISSDILKRRPLMKQIRSLYPNLEIIERDFSSPLSPAKEADLILSPATALMLTTLQMIKQKPLPGQKDTQSIKHRIAHLSLRYERLIIFVSEGQLANQTSATLESHQPEIKTTTTTDLDSRDSSALASLSAFCASLEGQVIPTYLPGTEADLTRWIVNAIVQYHVPRGEEISRLIHEETLWELFLRRLTINPFAAQCILASLKADTAAVIPFPSNPSDATTSPSQPSTETLVGTTGLPAFLLLSSADRIARFCPMMGGRRILARVGKVLDGEWSSARNGYVVAG